MFPFPGRGAGDRFVVGGGDAAVMMRRSPAAEAFIRYLATPQAAAVWAADGGFVSPNLNVDLSVYPDPISRTIARSLVEAGDNFRFDLSDLQPVAFGGIEGRGMRGTPPALPRDRRCRCDRRRSRSRRDCRLQMTRQPTRGFVVDASVVDVHAPVQEREAARGQLCRDRVQHARDPRAVRLQHAVRDNRHDVLRRL